MDVIRYTLLSDGSSDRALMPILAWLLHQHLPRTAVQGGWADMRRLPQPPQRLSERIKVAVELYPCDMLFIHRDAERMERNDRVKEIFQALPDINVTYTLPPIVCVVPVRMMEAWLLFDEDAIRSAAGNPSGQSVLGLPRLRDMENLPDPKQRLEQTLRAAKGNIARRRQTNDARSVHRVAELIEDFSPLRALPAFQAFEADLVFALNSIPDS